MSEPDPSDISAAAAQHASTRDAWGALAVLMALAFLNYMDRNLVFPLLGKIGSELDLPTDKLGALATGFYIVYACSAPLFGWAADRMSRKTILVAILTFWSIVTALSGTATTFAMLLVWRSLTGLGEGGYFPTAVSLIGDLFSPRRRGIALALHGVCNAVGGGAGYAVGGILGARYGWRAPFFLAIAPGLVLVIVILSTFREPRSTAGFANAKKAQAELEEKARPYLRVVTQPALLLIAFTACAAAFAINGLNAFLPLYLEKERGISVSSAGALTGAFFSMGVVGQLAGGWCSDRFSSIAFPRPLLVAIPYAVVAPAAWAIVHSEATTFALIGYGITQLGRGFAEPNIYATVLDVVPARERGTAQGFMLAWTFIGSSVAPWAAGWVIRKEGYVPAIHLLGSGAMLAAILAIALAVLVRRHRRGLRED